MTAEEHAEEILHAISEYIYVYATPNGCASRYQQRGAFPAIDKAQDDLKKVIADALRTEKC